MIEVYFDGLCEPTNPEGIACYGYLIKRNGNLVRSHSGVIGEGEGMTNNVAEFTALQKALEDLVLNQRVYRHETIRIYGDSSLVINQCSRKWKVKSDTSRKFVPPILNLLEQIKEAYDNYITLVWISRNYNEEADELAREAYNMYILKNGGKVKL